MTFWNYVLGVLFLIICFLLIIIILLQKGKGGGLGAAFGGAGSSAFGTRTGDVFTWVTIVLTGLFLLLAIGTGLQFRPEPKTVEPPQFAPPAGPISETIPVTISCGTDGATIRYTTDGTDPDKNCAAYDKALHVDPGTTIKARAYRADWTPSEIVTAEYSEAKETTTAPGNTAVPGLEGLGLPGAPATRPAAPAAPTTMPAAPAMPTTMPAAG